MDAIPPEPVTPSAEPTSPPPSANAVPTRQWVHSRNSISSMDDITSKYRRMSTGAVPLNPDLSQSAPDLSAVDQATSPRSSKTDSSPNAASSDGSEKSRRKTTKSGIGVRRPSKAMGIKELEALGITKQYDAKQIMKAKKDKLAISEPKSVEHRAHVGFTKDGEMEMTNLPTEWQSLMSGLNNELKAIGAAGVTKEEFDFIVTNCQTVPKSVEEVKKTIHGKIDTKALRASQILYEQQKELIHQQLQEPTQIIPPSQVQPLSPRQQADEHEQKLQQLRTEFEAKLQEMDSINSNLEQKIQVLELQVQNFKEQNTEFESSNKKLEAKASALDDEKSQLHLELEDVKAQLALITKKSDSAMQYAQRKVQGQLDQLQKKLVEEQQSRTKAEQMNKELKQQVAQLQQQVKTAMNADVKEARVQFENELLQLKQKLTVDYEEVKIAHEQERTRKQELEKETEQLQVEVNELKSKLEEYNAAQLNVAEMKKKYLMDLQVVKGELLLEVKKYKTRYEQEREAKDKLKVQYDSQLRTERSGSVFFSSPPSIAPSSSIAPPPPAPVASSDGDSNQNNPLLNAIASAKLKQASKEKQPIVEEPVQTTHDLPQTDNMSVTNVLAFALLARRHNMAHVDEDEANEEDDNNEEWE